ncbi:MAG: right-handed parallel beta-helix repeat-containing protein [Myxococcota bacterium]
MWLWIVSIFFAASAVPAFASDGVLEINQTCAVDGGCFSGDLAGYPVTIDASAGRSYRLTSDLLVPDENTNGIRVGADDVSIDLAGFEIRGPVVCSGFPLSCAPAEGSGSGIRTATGLETGTSVANGSVRGMGLFGVNLGAQATVTNLRVRSNAASGIYTSEGATISGVAAHRNGEAGIVPGGGSTVSGNSAYQNGNDGIAARSGTTVSGNSVYQNGANGISAFDGATVSGNTAHQNVGHGIQTGSGCAVTGNAVRANGGFGLVMGPQSGFRENVISNNQTGSVGLIGSPAALNLGDNACDGTSTCTPPE